jgi:signal transduction histidine kinase
MLRHGIFLKIYLCFWLTIILVIALNQTDKRRPLYLIRQNIEASFSMYGQAALAYHRTGNPQAAARLAEQFKKNNGVNAYLLDDAGKRLDGGLLPQSLGGLAALALHSGKAEYLRTRDADLLALSIPGPDEKPYLVVGSHDHRSFIPSPFGENHRMTLRISILLIIPGVVCYLLARYLVSPLLALSGATRRFAQGDLAVRIGARAGNRKDETTELARDFDMMAEQIESLVKLQRQLIGDVSHELRSPLARLNVALDLARQNTGPEAEHALDRIEEEAQELNDMIGELLTLTRLESGDACIEMAPVNLTELLREIVEDGDFEAQGSNRGVKLIECAQCTVNGNGELLRRAVENVVRNAIHYTAEHTDVEIGIGCGPADRVAIRVRDHGPGVPESELGNIFRPFYRASQSRERQTGGTGLGLAISRRAVELHHGTVSAENAPDGGLIVTFLL